MKRNRVVATFKEAGSNNFISRTCLAVWRFYHKSSRLCGVILPIYAVIMPEMKIKVDIGTIRAKIIVRREESF